MLLVAVGIGLFIRLKCRKDSEKPAAKPARPTVTTPPPVADAAVAVQPPVADAAPVEDKPEPPAKPAYDGPALLIGALSADRSRALLVSLESYRHAQRYRVVKIDDGTIETDLDLAAFGEMEDSGSQAVLDDVVRARAVLRGFPLGSGRFSRIASSADGTRGAFEAGDPMYLVEGDKRGAKVALPAAYNPLIGPDGTLWMRGYDGQIDGEGKYSLFALAGAGPKPKKIAGTDAYTGLWHLTKTNTLRIVVSQPPTIAPCVVDVSLTKPYKVLSKFCPERALDGSIEMSPSGDYIAWAIDDGEETRHVKVMEYATKQETLDVKREGNLWISDEGRVVFVTNSETSVWEPKLKSFRESTAEVDYQCEWRNANEMVCADGGSVRVVAP